MEASEALVLEQIFGRSPVSDRCHNGSDCRSEGILRASRTKKANRVNGANRPHWANASSFSIQSIPEHRLRSDSQTP